MAGGYSSYDQYTDTETYESGSYWEKTSKDYKYGGYTYTDSNHSGSTYTNSEGYSYYSSKQR